MTFDSASNFAAELYLRILDLEEVNDARSAERLEKTGDG